MTSALSTVITHLQVFGIGFTFGLAGPCLLVCTPPMLIYIAGTKTRRNGIWGAIFTFLSGRMAAYLALGCMAGISAALLRRFTAPDLAVFLKPAGGVLGIVMAILVLTYKEPQDGCGRARNIFNKASGFGSIFAFGFLVGIMPCAPLVLFLSEIILISKNGFEGTFYMLFFGLGTSLSSLLVLGVLGSLAARAHSYLVNRRTGNRIFKIICASLLAFLGITMILQ